MLRQTGFVKQNGTDVPAARKQAGKSVSIYHKMVSDADNERRQTGLRSVCGQREARLFNTRFILAFPGSDETGVLRAKLRERQSLARY